jgi:RNA polymerase sigma factor (sigma-70 family)
MALYNLHTDEQLLHLLKDGDEAAFTELFGRYRNKLYYYLIKHTKSSEIAEEIVTDIFMKLWEGRELAGQISGAGAFFHKVGYYKAMDFLRITARHARLTQAYIVRVPEEPEKPADELMIDTEMKVLLYKAISQLPPQRRLIYRLSREEGLTHEQIAEALHLSRSTVNNALTTATRSITQFLHQQVPGNAALSLLFFLS